MIQGVLKKIFGSRNERLLKQYGRTVREINALEPEMSRLSDEQLRAKTDEFRARIQERVAKVQPAGGDAAPGAAPGTESHEAALDRARREALDEILPEAFAVVREAGKRVLNMRHFDVQLIGGIALHNGKIGEMRTGEGKTLVATLPTYLNALAGLGVHLVTVNDYLASRDSDWMGKIYRFLGMTVGVNLSQMEHDLKQEAYAADITYGTNNEFGFDYLRDNMVFHTSEKVQRPLYYAVVDEVDSILIDEARTPLIISGQAEDTTDLYLRINEIAPKLTRQKDEKAEVGDYWVDEKAHQVILSEAGHEHAEQLMEEAGLLPPNSSLYDAANINLMHHLSAALRAHSLFHRDQQYVVQDGEIIIVDEFTGRLMPGRRWSEGLHQAVEAKEGVEIQKENQTLATITFQNYFRMYKKLSGMTGTADTEAYEFQQIYGLETVVIPPHRKMVRDDRMDQVFRTSKEKYQAIINDIRDCYERGQPALVGTTSIENSELISGMLKKENLPHNVLNAKQHAREAEIVVQAGRPKMVTIATNMAGRGTDIVLGGNPEPEITAVQADESLTEAEKTARVEEMRHEWQKLHNEVVASGGLHIVGTERHESRRIDNQLRGRSGRQGDPGSSRFYLSLEDQLLRIFASDRVAAIMERLKMPEGEAIEHPWVTRSIENAQRKVEARNFDDRGHARGRGRGVRRRIRACRQPRRAMGRVQPRAHPRERARPLAPDQIMARSRYRSRAGRLAPARRRRGAPAVQRQGRERRCAGDARLRARDHAAEPRQPLARASFVARPPAPGHPPARLRAEEPDPGIQARSFRAVLAAARADQDRSDQGPDDGPDPQRRRAPADRRARGAGQRRIPASRIRRRRARRLARRHGGRGHRGARQDPPAAFRSRRRQSRPQRPVPVRLGQEVQALPRQADLTWRRHVKSLRGTQ
jgi:preprotein translocase subunit SecA